MNIAGIHPVCGEQAKPSGQFVIGRCHHAAVAAAAKILRRIKAEAAHVAPGPRAAPAMCRADGLCRVFNDVDSRVLRDLLQPGHVGGAAEQVDRNDGLRV